MTLLQSTNDAMSLEQSASLASTVSLIHGTGFGLCSVYFPWSTRAATKDQSPCSPKTTSAIKAVRAIVPEMKLRALHTRRDGEDACRDAS